MARTNIQVVITARDGASAPLEKVEKNIKKVGKASKDSTAAIWQFNKTLFSTFAFVGLFTKGFNSLRESLMIGAELDKVSTQFERQIGPKSKFIQALGDSTNVVIDEMTALRAGLELGNLGITKSTEDAATTVAKFAVAGKLAGKDATSVIEGLTAAVVDGNVAKLEELGIMRRSDPAFMSLMAVVGKAGGVMGGTLAKQQAMAIVMGAINKRVQDQMFSFMSLGDVIEYTGKAYGNLRRNIGVLLGNAIRPLLEKLLPLIQSFNKIVESISRTDKESLFLVKTVLALTGAISGLFAALGTMSLMVKLLGFTPLGFSGMAVAILAVTAAFVGLTRGAETPLAKLKLFGAFFKGIYELVTNFDPETGMSKISEATQKLLSDNGILGFVDFIAASIVTVKTTIKDIVDFVTYGANKVDSIIKGIFGGINDSLKGTAKWTTWWTTDTLSSFDKIKRAAMVLTGVIGAIFLGKKLFGMAGGILSKIPVIGGMFGSGGGKGPKGTPTDPIYTVGIGEGIGKLVTPIISKIPDLLMRTAPMFGSALAVTAAAGIGAALGTFIESALEKSGITQGETQAGYKGGIMERVLYHLSNPELHDKFQAAKDFETQTPEEELQQQFEHANFMNWTKLGETSEQWKIRTAPNRAKSQTAISVPVAIGDDESIIQTLGEQMKSMKQSDKDKMQGAIEGALKSPANGGGFIDPEEFTTFQNLLTAAFDESKNLQELVRITQEKKIALRSNQRG